MRKFCLLFILILIPVFSLMGCRTGGNGPDTPISQEISHFEPVTDITDGRKDIYLIIKVMDSSYWNVIVEGVKAAGVEYDCNIYCGGTFNETDWPNQRILIEEAVDRGADALILAPDDSVELAPDIDRVHNLGIPVILIDTAANTESFDICYMTDNLYAGHNAAKEMLSRLHAAGFSNYDDVSVGIMVGAANSQTINERLAGFYQYWSNNAPGKWSIISDIMNCNGNVDTGHELVKEFLEKYPDVKGLYGTNNGPTRAICRVIGENKRTDITVVGFDFSDEIRDLIMSPDHRASTILQRQYEMGYHGVISALEIMDKVTPPVRFVDTGVVTVNKETLNSPEVEEVLRQN